MLNWNRRNWRFFLVDIAQPILIAYRDVIELSGAVPLVITVLFVAAQVHAGEIEPRAYVNTPVEINFLLTGYAYSDARNSLAAFPGYPYLVHGAVLFIFGFSRACPRAGQKTHGQAVLWTRFDA